MPQTFPEGCCVHFLLLCNKLLRTLQLKTTPIYHLTVLEVKSLGRLNWALHGGFHRLQSRVAQGGICFSFFQVVGRIQLLVVVGLRFLFSPHVLPPASRGCSQVLAPWPPLPESQEEPSLVESLSGIESLRLFCYEPKKTQFLKDL